MDSHSSIRIEKLQDDNLHTWKTRMQLVLALKEADFYLVDDPPASDSPSYSEWRKGDLKAKVNIGLTLSDNTSSRSNMLLARKREDSRFSSSHSPACRYVQVHFRHSRGQRDGHSTAQQSPGLLRQPQL